MANQIVPGSGSSMPFSGRQQPPVFGHPTNTKKFVGSLAWETTSETLQLYFEQFGEIIEAVVITDKYTGRSKGYGFVTFVDAEAANRACVNPNPVINRRRANCNLASFGRSAPFLPYARVSGNQSPLVPFMRSPYSLRVPYMGNPMYQLPVPYAYHPGLSFPMYGYPSYGYEYLYPQMYGVPETTSTTGMLCNQLVNPTSTTQKGRPIIHETPHVSDISVEASGTSPVIETNLPKFDSKNGSEQMTS